MRPARGLTPLLVAVVVGVLLAGCGSSSPTPSPTPTPLPLQLLRQRYLAAANAYISAEQPIAQAENMYCVLAAPTADLVKCTMALSSDRQTTIIFDTAVRAIEFPPSSRSDVSKLLNDDAQLEILLQQASVAPSLSAVNALTPQIFQLLATSSNDAGTVRKDIGLPLPSTSPPAA
ncbi:MAG: hypothetical protein JOY80_07030 [Candidatus Dormibacteraeota bacterium]|nr:hypothetical protein [Candidatus Dormibacteraeota bacterium]